MIHCDIAMRRRYVAQAMRYIKSRGGIGSGAAEVTQWGQIP